MIVLANVLTPFENFLRAILDWFHNTAHLPWAWAVVAVTVLVRIVIVPLTIKQIHSMQSLQAHMPEMKEIQKKYKSDKQRQQQELMAFYKENQINPFASCLPIVVQIPIFFTLYLVLRHFSKHPPCPLPNAHDCIARGDFSWLSHGFVPDMSAHASAHWGGFVLLAVYALSQLASTYFMSTSTDKLQRYLMMALPLFILPALINFPTGLVIYWMTTNLWTVGQGLVIRRMIPRMPAPPVQRRSSRTPAREPVPDRPAAKPRQQQQPVMVRRVKRKKGSKR